MLMTPRVRKLALTLHVSVSVGWLGAVACFLALAIATLTSQEAQLMRAAPVILDRLGWFVLVPFSLASLITGVISSIGTPWGLFRHYWVLFKLLINIFATINLLLYMQTLGALVDLASAMPESRTDLDELRSLSPVLHVGAAMVLVLVATTLAVFKPRGQTPYGQRKQREKRAGLVS